MQEFSSKSRMFVLKHENGTPAVIGNDRNVLCVKAASIALLQSHFMFTERHKDQ